MKHNFVSRQQVKSFILGGNKIELEYFRTAAELLFSHNVIILAQL